MKIKSVASVYVIVWLLMLLGLVCCNIYESEFPITDSDNSSINDNWLGTWVGLDSNAYQFYPAYKINLQAFNDKEYIASMVDYTNNGKHIRSVDLFKVFDSQLGAEQYLNIQPIGTINDDYFFYKIEEDQGDSIFIRFITDTLEHEFHSSEALSAHLLDQDSITKNKVFSQLVPFYRWKILTWNYLNKINKSSRFDKFYLLGELDEEHFINASENELETMIVDKKETRIDTVQAFFKGLQFRNSWVGFWKIPHYAVIKMKSGHFVKVKYDKGGPLIKDLTSDIEYVNISDVERGF